MLSLLLSSIALAEGLAIQDGELKNPHVDVQLTPDQVAALAVLRDGCPAEELALTPEQRSVLAERTGVTVPWVDARPLACWTDCTCGDSNLALVNGTRLSIQLTPVSALRLSEATTHRYEAGLGLPWNGRTLKHLSGDDAPPSAQERATTDALISSAPKLVDPKGTVVTDTLGTYTAIGAELPAGATIVRIRHAHADISSVWENEVLLPLRRSELQVDAAPRSGPFRWPDSAMVGDRVLLASRCSHEADGDFPCYLWLTYAGDHLLSAVQVDVSGEPLVFMAQWSGETLQNATAQLRAGQWFRWGLIDTGPAPR